MAMQYQGFATLGVNLNRQKYGPLDISTVFTSVADLNFYISKGSKTSELVSNYWKNVVPYPYAGQIISLVENNEVTVYKLVENSEGTFDTFALGGDTDIDLTNYATKTEVQKMIDALEIPEDVLNITALTDEEILDICK